jgi:hypothetical protein
MSIGTTADQSNQLTVFVATGNLTDTDVIDALESFYTKNPTLYSIWDYRNAPPRAFPTNQIRDVLKIPREYGDVRRGGKTAFIVKEEMEFELLKILKLAIDLTFKMRVFNTLEDAKEWLYGDE